MRTTIRPLALIRSAGLWASRGTLAMFAAAAVSGPAMADEIEKRYGQDRALCRSGMSPQDQATCFKEAAAARDAARRGQLSDNGDRYRSNARDRCEDLSRSDARACRERVGSQGEVTRSINRDGTRSSTTTTRGSVEGGGIIRETVTREVMPADPVEPRRPSR